MLSAVFLSCREVTLQQGALTRGAEHGKRRLRCCDQKCTTKLVACYPAGGAWRELQAGPALWQLPTHSFLPHTGTGFLGVLKTTSFPHV